MRILHTADWHLGVTSNRLSRSEDHELFFEWLIAFMREKEVDALVVAGDIFDTYHPSAAAQEQYYRFLARCRALNGVEIVVVGGNHDAPSRLAAPATILRALDVHVVAGLTRDSVEQGEHILPLKRRDGTVGAVMLAVPFVPEWRLADRNPGEDHEAARRHVTEGFRSLFAQLPDQAEAGHPGVPILATGHLTLASARQANAKDIEDHRVGTIDALSPDIFDPRICYIALGHVHQSYPVDAAERS